MCRLFETIRVENGIPLNLVWHERRMNQARAEFWPYCGTVELGVSLVVPGEMSSGIVRCNIFYGKDIEEITFKSYEKRVIRSLKLVYCDNIDYPFKYSDRSHLERLFELREDCDEIIIVKNGYITDTSISNLIFFNGVQWFTPSRPLHNGTCRQRLISAGLVSEREITIEDLPEFTGCKLINAMRDPEGEEMINMSVSSIGRLFSTIP
ncbi:MAG: aminotransferase class IV family protein [Bacteroidetes bacterium]|nr:aminotransferase class IV family protein [Bacteroidota bacterium]